MPIFKSHLKLVLSIIALFGVSCLSAQTGLLNKTIFVPAQKNSLSGHIDNLQFQEGITISFNSSRVDLNRVINIPRNRINLGLFLDALFKDSEVSYQVTGRRVLVAFIDKPPPTQITLSGYVRDSETGEILVGAYITELKSETTTFSGESGFYSITVPIDSSSVMFEYLGYGAVMLDNYEGKDIDILMSSNNELQQVIIKGSISDDFVLGSGGEKIDFNLTKGFQSTEGSNDLIKAVRINAGVQSGNEGQTGLHVRGGSQDQNLILFDGVPLYEVSHSAGLSSMFIEETIHNVDFIKNGFPARYGGRLSSVLNVQLKDGHKSEINGSVTASLPSIKAHLEGPILSGKTTFNIASRISYIDTYLDNVVGDLVNYDIGINYNDIVAKVTHRFAPNRKVSFSYYSGGDKLSLGNTQETSNLLGDKFTTISDVGLRWGSKVWSANMSNIVSDKLQLRMNIGGVNYKYSSRGSYQFESSINNLISNAELDVIAFSEITDYQANVDFDYYLTNKHILKFGAGWIYHSYNPAVRSNQIIEDGVLTRIENEENRINADELSLFFEDTYTPHPYWQFYAGMHFSGYNVASSQYRNSQPRISAVFKPGSRDRFTLSYTQMYQYVHLLVNSGIGLPSNLWVPSTDDIGPESARQLSLSYSRKLTPSITFALSAYTKEISNILEYRSAVDLIFLGGTNLATLPLEEDSDWQKRVEIGNAESYGIEMQLQKYIGKLTGWATFTYGKTTRQFDAIDNGDPFPYKYDRRHDVNFGSKYSFSDHFSMAVNWTYGSGNFFSLSIEEFKSPFGTLRTSGERNNFQQEPFHHLDLQLNYGTIFSNGNKVDFNIGLYNAYNRRNAYFIYIYDSPILGRAEARKTSLFPILPNLSIRYQL